MRPAPGPIPATLPDVDKVIRNIVHLLDKPRDQLCGMSVQQLVDTYARGPAWLTGSTAWLPAVFDTVEYDTDFDIVLANNDDAQKFIDGVMAELNQLKPGTYQLGRNKFGSARIEMVTGSGLFTGFTAVTPIMDIWALDGDESIQELVLSYPNDYQRVAYFMGYGAPQVSSLTRIVKMRQRPNTTQAVLGRFTEIRQARNVY